MNIYDEFIIDEFHDQIVIHTTGMWEWLGPKDSKGRAMFITKGLIRRACIVAYEIEHSCTILEDVVVEVDNPLDVNPQHLQIRPLTLSEQIEVKGKGKGSHHKKSVLTEKDIIDIYILNKEGVTGKEIAEMYQVSKSLISKIITGKRWTWLYNLYH